MNNIGFIRKVYSLVLIRDLVNKKVLLGYKKRGFGKDKYNGFGGKVEKNESILECAIREVKEESGLNITDAKKVGYLEFQIGEETNEILEAHIFKATKFNGNIVETEEMVPKWFAADEIPYNQMWADDEHWFPLFLDNKCFKGFFLFKKDEATILNYNLNVVESFE